ncbi:hypothetical protein C8R47DRAFT_1313420 [Mycena vitilis]|nr:hypothetical protein C8R47DRAFT_1313420 [Mycena vitilis]
MHSPPHSSRLASDIRALTTALALVSSTTSSRSPTSPKSNFKHHGNGPSPGPQKVFHHIATLLTRDNVDEADVAFTGATMQRHFALFAIHQSPLSAPPESPTSSPIYENGRHLEFRSTDCSKIRLEVLTHPEPVLDNHALDAVFKTGLNAADLDQHVSDVKHILLGFSGADLSDEDRDVRQTRCSIFFEQRSIEKLTQRFHNPRIFFSAQNASWWRILAQWDPDPDDFPVREFKAQFQIAIVFNALSPGLMSHYLPTILDRDTAVECITGLAVLLDVINGKLSACTQPGRSDEDWERLNTTLRMLYSLLYETDIIHHIFFNTSLSAHLLSRSKSAQFGEHGSDYDKHDGPFLFRQLQKIVAWHRALLVLASTKVVRAAIPIQFNAISIPPQSLGITPIMDLVNEIYTSRHLRTLLRSHLRQRGVFSENRTAVAVASHYNATLMGILMATEYHEYSYVFAEEEATDSRKIRELKDGILQVIGNGKQCCYVCEKLASLLAVNFKEPTSCSDGLIFRPWSPPFGMTREVLTLLRDDLMDQLRRHLERVILHNKFAAASCTIRKSFPDAGCRNDA